MSVLSLRAYARHRGVSLAAVQKAIRYGRIQVVDGGIDPAQADADWVRNTGARRPRSLQGLSYRAPLTYSVPQVPDRPRPEDVEHGALVLHRYLADLAQVECEARMRRLIDRDEVESAMLMIAHRAAHMLARETDPASIQALLAEQIRAALRVLTVTECQ